MNRWLTAALASLALATASQAWTPLKEPVPAFEKLIAAGGTLQGTATKGLLGTGKAWPCTFTVRRGGSDHGGYTYGFDMTVKDDRPGPLHCTAMFATQESVRSSSDSRLKVLSLTNGYSEGHSDWSFEFDAAGNVTRVDLRTHPKLLVFPLPGDHAVATFAAR